jgi:hypothetical protein
MTKKSDNVFKLVPKLVEEREVLTWTKAMQNSTEALQKAQYMDEEVEHYIMIGRSHDGVLQLSYGNTDVLSMVGILEQVKLMLLDGALEE